MEPPYVIIVHKSLRSFTLNRCYGLICLDFELAKPPQKAVEEQVGWLPTYGYQRPVWVDLYKPNEFTAYWMY
jgi:hypothetical protein